MLNAHISHIPDLMEQGYVEVGRSGDRLELCHPDRTCLRLLRTGRCRMDLGHLGRCTTVVHYCDFCGKTRRGSQPHQVGRDSNGDPDIAICFFCAVVDKQAS